ncbi:hypothetical protein HBI56_084060 [Parastagonospora nodorum]|nr:hypothetical protein HBH53_061930 [Parastagonospora nodorum]KAH4191388.1 hypothetical protein HBH42_124730 [Parastagonospora nodorum]KAH4224930.1 hypothetical protein HBI06_118610 [Parastagonospora nodorum]KAH4246975.1 hypothetical protein HBI05_038990 [Parastagonospora nodorum]KAH5030495.1 hypothetical protein HBI74_100950 [Parastagonospora nodorum]
MSTADQAFDATTNSVPTRDNVAVENEDKLNQPGVTSNQAHDVPHKSIPTGDEDELDNSDAVSDTSTLEWDHESFETFQHRVLELALTLWDGTKASDIEVTRLAGGGYNRIIGITKIMTEQQQSLQPGILKRLWTFMTNWAAKMRSETIQTARLEYILRIPRMDAARLDQYVAALHYVQNLGGIPVPDIVAFDETTNNRLGIRYMVQNRLPGTDLLKTFPDLDHNQKFRVAVELGQVFRTMLSTKSAVAGRLVLPRTVRSSKSSVYEASVEPLFQPDLPTIVQIKPNLAIKDLLSGIFQEREAQLFREHGSKCKSWSHNDRFIAMTSELDAEGWFASKDISICHLDFEPRNILVDITKNSPQPIVSAILDWDSAALAPSFMSCRPPLWIWAWAEDEDEDERTANDEPPTEEGRILKQAFEQAAGPEFIRYAYPSAYRLARRLVQFAMDGITFSQDFRDADAMLEEWAELRKSSVTVDT